MIVQEPMKRDPTKWIITFGFGGLLVIMGIGATFSIIQMYKTVEYMTELVEITNNKINLAHSMRDHIRLRGEVLTAMYLSDDFFYREEKRLTLSEHGLKYLKAREKLQAYGLNEAEKNVFEKIKPIARIARTANLDLSEALLTELDHETLKQKFISAAKYRNDLNEALGDLIVIQRENTQAALETSIKLTRQTQFIVILLSVTGFIIGIIISLFVIRKSAKKNLDIQHQASHDSLTQLVNRLEFEYRLDHVLNNAKTNHKEHVLCFLDLDQFKLINDACGHEAGDALLKNITKLLLDNIRGRDTLARLGGDEFGLLLESCPIDNAILVCEGLVNLVQDYKFTWEDRMFNVGVSIGVTPVNDHSESVSQLMSQADIACYAAKDMGRGQVHVHELSNEHVKKIHKELGWIADIGKSISENRFKLFSQPIAAINGDTSITMHEVLLRLKDDDGNYISPGAYIPAAERFDLMREVDIWVIKQTFDFLSQLHNKTSRINLKLFINLSTNSLSDKNICDFILDNIKSSSIPTGSICFEITESAAIRNITKTAAFMKELQGSKCSFSLDNFGSGMSSFTHLKDLPVDYLKISGALVKNIADNTLDHAMVAAINQIGKIMHIRTIAEHVENARILRKLEQIGIDYAQGYHISKPKPIEEIEPLLITRPTLVTSKKK